MPGNEINVNIISRQIIVMLKMADETRSPAKKRRKMEKKDVGEKEETEKHQQSVKRTGKAKETHCICTYK